jgi:putative transcriptional regulator
MQPNEYDISGTIRALRKQLGLTQEKFAARLGVAFPTINRWENDHTKPSPLALKQIETLLVEAGLSWQGRPPPPTANEGP